MKQLFIIKKINIFLSFLLFVQPFQGCKSNSCIKTNSTTIIPYTRLLIKNIQSTPKLIWFSKDSSALHYFYGTHGTHNGAIPIMHAIQDGCYFETTNPFFVLPYQNFIRFLDTNDSLIVIIKDSTSIRDIYISDVASLSFISDYELNCIKALGYKESVVLLK